MSENLLLAALPREERKRLEPFLKYEKLEVRTALIEADEPIENLYFPYDCITSTLQEMSDGSSIESGLMGVEGLIGIQLWLNVRATPTRTIVQVEGHAHRMRAEDFIREVMNRPESPLNRLIARYVHAFLTMSGQTAACNRLHTIDERLCRWLKLTHNRIRRDEFDMRHEFLAMMLGVHRPTVSTAANILQKAGLISYSRGRIKILDSEGLAEGACECYEIMEAQFDKIFDRPWRAFAREEDDEKTRGTS